MRKHNLCLAALVCAAFVSTFVGSSLAGSLSVSLNLEFNDPSDFGSGGTWTAVAKADERGIAGIVLYFDSTTLNFSSSTGLLTPVGFEIEQSMIGPGMKLEIVQGDDFSDPTLDVGVIGGTYPSTYADDPGLAPFGANPDLGSFTGGVALATGSFDPGDIPAWFAGSGIPIDGNLFVGTPPVAEQPDLFYTVRAVVPEPATMLLACCSLVALASRRRNS